MLCQQAILNWLENEGYTANRCHSHEGVNYWRITYNGIHLVFLGADYEMMACSILSPAANANCGGRDATVHNFPYGDPNSLSKLSHILRQRIEVKRTLINGGNRYLGKINTENQAYPQDHSPPHSESHSTQPPETQDYPDQNEQQPTYTAPHQAAPQTNDHHS